MTTSSPRSTASCATAPSEPRRPAFSANGWSSMPGAIAGRRGSSRPCSCGPGSRMSRMSERLPVYLVRGDDPSLRAEAVRALVHELVGSGDQSLMVEEFEPVDEGDTAAIADAAQTPPFLTERRIVVARDVASYSSEALEPLLRYLDDPLESSSLVLVTGDKGKLSQKLLNAVKKAGHVIESGVPANKRARDSWLAEQLKDAPVRLDAEASRLLDGHLGEDLGRLRNLLEALAAAYGHDAKIAVDDLRPFLGDA